MSSNYILEDWNGTYNLDVSGDEVRITSRNITTNLGTYTVYSTRSIEILLIIIIML